MKRHVASNRLISLLFAIAMVQLTPSVQAADAAADHAEHSDTKVVQGKGVVQAVDAKANTIKLSHEAIPAINWPAMTMQFKVLGDAEEQVKAGDTVVFELEGNGSTSTISKISKAK